MKFYPKEIGKRIAQVRKQEGINQQEFAKIMEVSTATLSLYERGERNPDTKFMTALNDLYNADPHWLLTGEDRPRPSKSDILTDIDEATFYAVMDTALRYGYYRLPKGDTSITLAQEILEEYERVLSKKRK